MKIKIKEKGYEDVLALPHEPHKKPLKQGFFWRILLKAVSLPDLFATRFTCKRIGMERLDKRKPALFLMNHSSFIDLKIASSILFPRPFNIVCTTDGFVGKRLLMRLLGCIPTCKFVPDPGLVRDMTYALKDLKSSVLMFPEAGYSFDGTATALPDSLGRCAKHLGVPVVIIQTQGAFARDPLYNNLQRRRVRVSATMEYLLSPEEIAALPAAEIDRRIKEKFTFDSFRWQQENGIHISEPFRADHLNRILYKCPVCQCEGNMRGKGICLTCNACGKEWELDEQGYLRDTASSARTHVPDWYSFERACVKKELREGKYSLDLAVDIYMLVNTKALYHVGEGRLQHTKEGFRLTGCDGALDYTQGPLASYTLNSDFNWYEIGDVISIGNHRTLYYCFPKQKGDFAAKARLATEELYKLARKEKAEQKTAKKS